MKRSWRVIFTTGVACTMIMPEICDAQTAYAEAMATFLTGVLRVE